MMDMAKSNTFKNFTILNKALRFLIKINKTAVQSVLKYNNCARMRGKMCAALYKFLHHVIKMKKRRYRKKFWH